MAHEVTFIPGDGTGPELAEATRRVLEATGVEFAWDEHPAGEDVYNEEGNPFPDRTLESIKRNGVGIKGPTTTPVGSGFRSVNVLLRKELDLYACIRPCKAYEGVRTRFPETDIVIVRENTEDLYAGIEFEQRHRRGRAAARVHRRPRRLEDPRALRHLDQADLRLRLRADRARRVRLRARERPPQGDRRAQGEHHEALRRPLPRRRAQGRGGLRRHRVRGPHHRQPLQPARVAPGGVRRDRAAEPLRRHRLRPRRRHDRRPRASRPAATSAPRRRCSRRRTARRRSTRARTRSTRPR